MKATDFLTFKWTKDPKGYELRYLEAEVRQRHFKVYAGSIGNSTVIGPEAGWVIRGRGGRREEIEALKHSTLYLRFANATTNERLKNFVDSFGPLVSQDEAEDTRYAVEMPVDRLNYLRANLVELVSSSPGERRDIFERIGTPGPVVVARESEWPYAGIRADVHFDDSDQMRLRFCPDSLLSAIWLQYAIDVEAGMQVRTCPNCADFFGVGPNTNHRTSAVFCSPTCQNAAAYLRRKAEG